MTGEHTRHRHGVGVHGALRRVRDVARVVATVLGVVVVLTAGRARAQEPEAPAPSADAPDGFTDKEARDLAQDAETARAANLWDACIEKDSASIAKQDLPTTHVHLAGCAERAGKVVLALRHLQGVLDAAIGTGDAEVAQLAEQRVVQLLKRAATLAIDAPAGAKDLVVQIDGEQVKPEVLAKPVLVDPGKHRVHAEGVLEGTPMMFEEVVAATEGERTAVTIALRPRASEFLTQGQLACMQLAKTQEDVLRCLPSNKKALVVRAALEASGYGDTLSVLVFSPSVRASVASPTNGWSVSASYLVDMISAASPDFVSTASPRGHDTRHAANVAGGYKPGRFGFEATATYSDEADYTARSGSIALLGDLADKLVTPRIAYSYGHDTIGRGGTPYDVFSHTLDVHEVSGGSSFVLSPRSLLVAGVTAGFERGDQSKPYRLIPMFAPGVDVPKAASATLVNQLRLPVRPYEQLPLERDRYALALRFIQRLGAGTLRLEERLYDDSWQILASSTDLRFLFDLGSRLTVGPHARFHIQSAARFFHRVYHAETEPVVKLPAFRTTDRELGPLNALTGGLSAWLRLTDEHASTGLMLYASGDVMSTRYVDSLYVDSRLAGYGTLGMEAQFE